MITTRTISNISYNSDKFFETIVNHLVKSKVIEFCYWIRHEPDTDETKSHIHFVLRPSKRIDTSVLRQHFNEFDPTNKKPLSCTSVWRFTNSMDDWLLYCIHDPAYLKSKHLERNLLYSFDDMKSTDYDALNYDISMINRVSFDRLSLLEEAVKTGVPFWSLVQAGLIPINQRAQYEFQYRELNRFYFMPQDNTPVDAEFVILEDKPMKKSKSSSATTNNGKK